MCKDVYVFAEQRDGNLQKVDFYSGQRSLRGAAAARCTFSVQSFVRVKNKPLRVLGGVV